MDREIRRNRDWAEQVFRWILLNLDSCEYSLRIHSCTEIIIIAVVQRRVPLPHSSMPSPERNSGTWEASEQLIIHSCLGIAHSEVRNGMEFREKGYFKSHLSVCLCTWTGLERVSKSFFFHLMVRNKIPSDFSLLGNGSERNYKVPSVFLFNEMVRNEIMSIFIFRGMARNGIPIVFRFAKQTEFGRIE
jgi:hypothetical protein